MSDRNRRILLAEAPQGRLDASHFRMVEDDVPAPGDGEVLCRVILLSLDPANRAWMQGRTYRDQVAAGDVMAGYTLAEVVDGNGTGLEPGTIVACEAGWQDYAALPAASVQPIDVLGTLSQHMGVLGITGLTAFFGVTEFGRPREGETFVVSAAAGATGHVAGQIARILGASRVVGITGSDDKNRRLEEELGFDATVNHRDPDLRAALKAACPDGIDVYFDNVGGRVFEHVLARMRLGGRIACCGVVSQYDSAEAPKGPAGVPGAIVTRRLTLRGFIVLDHADRFAEATEQLAAWVADGRLRGWEDVVEGLESAPGALVGLLAGDNVGKRLVRVAPDPA